MLSAILIRTGVGLIAVGNIWFANQRVKDRKVFFSIASLTVLLAALAMVYLVPMIEPYKLLVHPDHDQHIPVHYPEQRAHHGLHSGVLNNRDGPKQRIAFPDRFEGFDGSPVYQNVHDVSEQKKRNERRKVRFGKCIVHTIPEKDYSLVKHPDAQPSMDFNSIRSKLDEIVGPHFHGQSMRTSQSECVWKSLNV